MATLREELDRLVFGDAAPPGATLALNARHVQAIDEARDALARCRQHLTVGAGAEILALELRESLDALGRVLGSVTPDDILGRVFSNFCIGK
jgi:tRNA modification GTPase